ncbi:MAG TPA: 50S ribosomal protein L35 [Patescibacteria group bacterium]|nr:50S ribosomal protein L35 [Patescibacteria group bacterium]
MPKLKTRKVAAKRFKVTGTGKLVHRVQGMRHIRRRKNKSRQRRQDREVVLKKAMVKHVKTYLPKR